jgi:hypothetical protein
MKYTKTHNPPKNILGWAGLDLNDIKKFPYLSSNFEKRFK